VRPWQGAGAGTKDGDGCGAGARCEGDSGQDQVEHLVLKQVREVLEELRVGRVCVCLSVGVRACLCARSLRKCTCARACLCARTACR
jgi:hypothetical protein